MKRLALLVCCAFMAMGLVACGQAKSYEGGSSSYEGESKSYEGKWIELGAEQSESGEFWELKDGKAVFSEGQLDGGKWFFDREPNPGTYKELSETAIELHGVPYVGEVLEYRDPYLYMPGETINDQGDVKQFERFEE